MLKGSWIVIIFTLFLIAVGIFTIIFTTPKPYHKKGDIFFSLPNKEYLTNNEVEVPIYLVGSNNPVNVIKIELQYSNSEIELKEITVSEKLPGFVVDRFIDNSLGKASITVGIPNPGVLDNNFEFAKIKVVSSKPGEHILKILPETSIVANNESSSFLPYTGSTLVLEFIE